MAASDYYDTDLPHGGRVTVCRQCGAVVVDTAAHDRWHYGTPDPREVTVEWLPTDPLGANTERMVVCDACGNKRCPRAGDPFKPCRETVPEHSPNCTPENRREGWYPAGCPRCEHALRVEVRHVTRRTDG